MRTARAVGMATLAATAGLAFATRDSGWFRVFGLAWLFLVVWDGIAE